MELRYREVEVDATKWNWIDWGQQECWRTEWIAATDPRRYAASRVMATWTRADGLQDSDVEGARGGGQSGEL